MALKVPDCGSLVLLELLELSRPTKDGQMVCEFRIPERLKHESFNKYFQVEESKSIPFRFPLLKSKDVFWYLRRATSELIQYTYIHF